MNKTYLFMIVTALFSVSAFANQKPLVTRKFNGSSYMNTYSVINRDGTCEKVENTAQNYDIQNASNYNTEPHLLSNEDCKSLTARTEAAHQYLTLGLGCSVETTKAGKKQVPHLSQNCTCVSTKFGTFTKGLTEYIHSVEDCIEQFPAGSRAQVLDIEAKLSN